MSQLSISSLKIKGLSKSGSWADEVYSPGFTERLQSPTNLIAALVIGNLCACVYKQRCRKGEDFRVEIKTVPAVNLSNTSILRCVLHCS